MFKEMNATQISTVESDAGKQASEGASKKGGKACKDEFCCVMVSSVHDKKDERNKADAKCFEIG